MTTQFANCCKHSADWSTAAHDWFSNDENPTVNDLGLQLTFGFETTLYIILNLDVELIT